LIRKVSSVATLMLLTAIHFFCIQASSAKAENAPHNAKDLFYQELKSQTNSNKGIAYCLELKRNGAPTVLCNNRYPFKSGDSLRFHIKSNTSGFAYIVLAEGSTGRRQILYPPENTATSNRLEAGKEYVVPENGMLTFDQNPGREKLMLVLSKTQLDLRTALANAKNVFVDSTVLTGLPEEKDGSEIFSNEGAYDMNSVGTRRPGQGQVFVVSKEADNIIALEIALNHLPPETGHQLPIQNTSGAIPPQAISNSSVNRPITDKWAFIIGVNKFVNGPSLRFCVKDAMKFRSYLINEAGFNPNHVLVLTDEKATTDNILRVMTKLLPQAVKHDDLVVLYFSCHGSGNLGGENTENRIVTHDFDGTSNKGILMQQMGDMIKQNIPSDRVVTILDLCFSGNAKDLEDSSSLDALMQGSGQIIVSACGPNEVSIEDPRIEQGLFSYHLIDALRQRKSLCTSFDLARERTIARAKEEKSQQHPLINYERWKGNDLVLSTKPVSPRP